MRCVRGFVYTVTLAFLGTAIATAQTGTEAQRREQPQRQQDARDRDPQPTRPDQARLANEGKGEVDRALATCLAIENSAEVQIAEFATQRLRDEQAKEFAQQLVRDHRAMLEKLQQFGVNDAGIGAAAEGRRDVSVRAGQADVNVDVNRPAGEARTERGERRGSATVAATSGQFDPLAIKREIAQECVRSAMQELESTEDIDRCFVGAQVIGHQHMLATLKVFQRHASPQLADALAQAAETTQQHLDHAKQLLKTLDKKAGTGTAANPTTGTTR